tara:strand:- start:2326 stop:2781 length:456 start_codon:yes stop_codon:yes gene_type:complete
MGNFDFKMTEGSNQDEYESSYEKKPPLEKGTYHVVIDAHKEKENSKRTGDLLILIFEVKQGPKTGEGFAISYNMSNPEKKAVEISAEQLSELFRAIGLTGVVKDIEDVLGNELIVDVDVDGEYNRIFRPRPVEKAPAPSVQQAEEPVPWES